jgi:hypothetical protein
MYKLVVTELALRNNQRERHFYKARLPKKTPVLLENYSSTVLFSLSFFK